MQVSPFLQEQLSAARARFAEGGALPDALLSTPLRNSWERSRQSGLLPWQAPQYDQLPRDHNIRAQAADWHLYQCVHQEIEQLWSAFGGPDWTIFCANPQGVIVHARQNPGCSNPVLRPIAAGRRMQERDIGTTAPSCVLSDRTEAIVDGNQHYLSAFAQTFCLSVPLWGTEGQVIGALDITGQGARDVGVLQEHFRQAALAAEDRLFTTLGQCHLLRVQHDPRWLGTPMAGVLAFEDDGRLRAASRLARRMLGLPTTGALPELGLELLFADALPAQQRRLLQPSHAAHRIARGDGSHVWVQHARAPLRGVPVTAQPQVRVQRPTPADEGDAGLQEQTLRAISQALQQHEGNVAATARQLGISRTTLYAKLRQARQAGLLPD